VPLRFGLFVLLLNQMVIVDSLLTDKNYCSHVGVGRKIMCNPWRQSDFSRLQEVSRLAKARLYISSFSLEKCHFTA
jgi:hypothetical protein